MAMFAKLLAILFAAFTFFSTSASAQVTEKVFATFDQCQASQTPYYPTISRPKAGGQRMTIADVHPVFKDGTCVQSAELVEVRNGQKTLVTGWAFLPGHFEIVRVGESYFMYQCSNSIIRIGPPDGWQPPAPTFVATTPTQPRAVEVDFVADEPRYTAPASNAGGSQYVGYNQGMSTGGKILTGVAILGGAYVLDRALDRASKPRTVNNITNTGQCAGANVVTTGDGNIVCSNVTTPPPVVPVCNAPNRMIGGVCTAPPVCQGMAVLDQNSFTCQCVSPNRVFSSGICETPRQCNTGETLGPDNVCRANGPHCRADQVVVGTQCQCPAGRVEVNGVCQVPVQYCPDGSVRPVNGQCPVICHISGQTSVNGVCQCPNGLEVRDGACRMPVEYCPNGSVRPPSGQCPLICTGGRIDRGGYCGCPVGQTEVNGFCQTPPQCRYDQILVGTTCQCPAGRVELNGACQVLVQCYNGQTPVNGICQCPAGQQLIGGTCQTPVVCVGGQVPQGNNTCACPIGQELFAGVCRIPLPACTISGQTSVNGFCQCPQGQQVVNGSCQMPLVCTGGQIAQGSICVCPIGQELFAGVCRIPLPPGGSIN